ncbi:MAG: MFS transporter [Desulfatiglandaceae bacterium]
MTESKNRPSVNFGTLLWHAIFLALASNFMDVDTIIPAMLINAGGGEIHLGIMTAIMLGGSTFLQLIFAGFISHRPRKKKFLLLGINLRIAALFALSALFFYSDLLAEGLLIILIFVFISQFSFSGAFANISYVDILGKSLHGAARRAFLSAKQIVFSIGIFISAVAVRQLLVLFKFPGNYALLFLLAGGLLLTASFGFWLLKETPTRGRERTSLLEFFAMIPAAVKSDRNLKFYLLLINSLGLGLSVLPFLIYLAKESFGISGSIIGNFLLLKTIGMLSAGFFLLKFSRRFKYRYLLLVSMSLAAAIPIAALAFQGLPRVYPFIFIFSGIFMATYKTAIEGILLEISTDDNRATYAGISGAGNVLTTIFPLSAGFLIKALGYTPVFALVSALVLASVVFAIKIDCQKETG